MQEKYRPFIATVAQKEVINYQVLGMSDRRTASEVEAVLGVNIRYRGIDQERISALFGRHLGEKKLIPQLLRVGTEELDRLTVDGEFAILHTLFQVATHTKRAWDNFQLTTAVGPNPIEDAAALSFYNPYREDPNTRPEVKQVVEESNHLLSDEMFAHVAKIKKHLQARLEHDPSQIGSIITFLHAWHMSDLHDELIDEVLGIDESKDDWFSRDDAFEAEQTLYEGTPYAMIRDFVHTIKPKKGDVVYDLGSGLGRVVLYSAMTTDAMVTGIELLEERVAQAEELKNKFGIENARFIQGNVLGQDFSDGTIFFMFNPFSHETTMEVIRRLRQINTKKRIVIASWAQSNIYLEKQPWLRDMNGVEKEGSEELRFFESSWPRLLWGDKAFRRAQTIELP